MQQYFEFFSFGFTLEGMRYLGIDYGKKRVGVAISDESGKMAFPDQTLPNNKNLISEIVSICEKKEIKRVIIGESRNYSGKPNEIMKKAEGFGMALAKAAKLEVVSEPEFLTSHQASKIQGGSNQIDASAATIILQSYLDKSKFKNQNEPI